MASMTDKTQDNQTNYPPPPNHPVTIAETTKLDSLDAVFRLRTINSDDQDAGIVLNIDLYINPTLAHERHQFDVQWHFKVYDPYQSPALSPLEGQEMSKYTLTHLKNTQVVGYRRQLFLKTSTLRKNTTLLMFMDPATTKLFRDCDLRAVLRFETVVDLRIIRGKASDIQDDTQRMEDMIKRRFALTRGTKKSLPKGFVYWRNGQDDQDSLLFPDMPSFDSKPRNHDSNDQTDLSDSSELSDSNQSMDDHVE